MLHYHKENVALLWTAPELLREDNIQGSQAGDVFSFGIVLQEVMIRDKPYANIPLNAKGTPYI